MNILLCTPTLGNVKTKYFTSVLSLIHRVNVEPGMNVDVYTIDNQLTQRARNILTDYFVRTPKYTHLFFIDSDIEFSANDFIKIAKSGEKIVCALYPNKVFHWTPERCIKGRDFLVNFSSRVTDENVKTYDPTTNLCDIDLAATGFTCIERSVFEILADKVPTYKIDDRIVRDYWNCKVIDDEWMTEDYVFSKLAKENGINIKADMSINLVHVGEVGYTSNPLNVFKLI